MPLQPPAASPVKRAARPAVVGFALYEGVAICSSQAISIAVRRPTGEVVTRVRPRASGPLAQALRRIAGLRGLFAAFEGLALFSSAMAFSVVQSGLFRPIARAALGSGGLPRALSGQRRALVLTLTAWLFWFCLGTMLVLGGVPLIFSNLANDAALSHELTGSLWVGLCHTAGALAALAFFTGYVNLLSQVRAFAAYFAYHGAEHQVRAAYRAHAALNVRTVMRYAAVDARCVMGRAVTLVALGFGLTALASLMSPQVASIVQASDGGWRQLAQSIGVRGAAVCAATLLDCELRLVLRRRWPHFHLGQRSGEWLCQAAVATPQEPHVEVALAALLRLLDSQEAQAPRALPAGYRKWADACVRKIAPRMASGIPHDQGARPWKTN